MPAIPISYSELHGDRPSEAQLSELISSFKTEPTFISLAMWNLMLSLCEGNFEKYKYLQGFFIHNLIRKDLRDRVAMAAALDSEFPRPVFGRWQLLALMKKILIETTDDGVGDPRNDDEARRTLGDACLVINDLLFSEEQEERLEESAGDRERVSDELMTQWLFQFELLHPPDVFQAIARNDEYINIFNRRTLDFRFANGQTLSERFKALTGLELRQYLHLYFSIWVLHNTLRELHPEDINANPSIINFDKQRIFALLDLDAKEQIVFFERILADLPSLALGVKGDNSSGRLWQFDFTTFRNYPLVYNSNSKRGFTCIAYPFLIEKLASGIYHTILSSWREGDPERSTFQSYWGKVFEQYVNDRLGEERSLVKAFYANPNFHRKQSGSLIEVSDAVVDDGDSLLLIEHKGGYLSLDEKYSGDVSKLLRGVSEKFGLGKGIKQLARSISRLFDQDAERRDTFSGADHEGSPVNDFKVEDARRIRKVYPVMVVQDFSMTIGFMNRRLRLQFEEIVKESSIDPKVQVCPLTVLTIENLEDLLEHLKEVNLTDVLDEYAKADNAPLSTFDDSFKAFLKKQGINQRRYHWSLKRGEEILNSIKDQFIRGI
jgi:hypothetical protein